MARAYAYAYDDGPYPPELGVYTAVNELGVTAVFGKQTLSAREIRDLMTSKAAQTIIMWFETRARSDNMAEWAKNHPQETRALELAHKEFEKWQSETK